MSKHHDRAPIPIAPIIAQQIVIGNDARAEQWSGEFQISPAPAFLPNHVAILLRQNCVCDGETLPGGTVFFVRQEALRSVVVIPQSDLMELGAE